MATTATQHPAPRLAVVGTYPQFRPAEQAPALPLPVRRFLTIREAAAYVGVCVSTFKDEVAAGMWPQPHRRGAKRRALTWDVRAIDLWADRMAGCTPHMPAAPGNPAAAAEAIAMLRFRGPS
jgi:predicted DNA-binding transcriptional regulator AlpA